MAHAMVFFVCHYFKLFMEPVYAKSSFLENVRKMIEDECSGKLSLCSQLKLTCHEELGEYGIWLNIGESHLLIDPLDLFESIFMPSGHLHVGSIVENGKKVKTSLRIEIVNEAYVYSWSLYHPGIKKYSKIGIGCLNEHTLHDCVDHQYVAILEYLLKLGANPNVNCFTKHYKHIRSSAKYTLVKEGHYYKPEARERMHKLLADVEF